jgi:hypothetical protein
VEGTVQQVIPSEGQPGVLKSALASSLGARCDPAGYLELDQRQRTSVPGRAINASLNAERWP